MRPRHLAAVALSFAIAVMAPSATAQDRRVAAEAAFSEGLAAFEAGRYEEACPKLAAAVDLTDRGSLGGLLLHAECQEKIGHVATAWALYREVGAKADRVGQADRAQKAREGEARVAPALHQMTIRVGPSVAGVAGLAVRRGTVEVKSEIFGVAVPVDPGSLVVRAEAPGYRPFERTVEIANGAGKTEVVIESLERDPSAPRSSPPGPTPRDDAAGGIGTLTIVGLVTGGVGLLGIGGSAIVMAAAKSDYDEAARPCPDATCTSDTDKQAVDDARGTGDLGTAVFIAGSALTAIGVGLIVIDLATGPAKPSDRSASVSVSPGRVSLAGSF